MKQITFHGELMYQREGTSIDCFPLLLFGVVFKNKP